MILDKLEPKRVMYFFEEISKIPRKSGNEKQIVEYLIDFAKKRNFQFFTDEYNNILIVKPASNGYEEKESFALQSHTDMICEKTENCKHDFSKDSLELYIDGDFIKAKNTTLGADNGIGVAIILAILDDKDLCAPEIEAIFTSEEETTMLGAINFDMSLIKSKRIISLDNGKEGMILVSSAACDEWGINIDIEKEIVNTDKYYRLTYKNFLGGHTGGNIGDEKRGNPIKLAFELLKNKSDVRLLNVEGGSRVNVIPRDITIDFLIDKNEIEKLNKEIVIQNDFYKKYNEEVEIILEEKNEFIKSALTNNSSNKIIDFVNDYKNGVIEKDKDDNIILSSCISVIKAEDENTYIEFSIRSNKKILEQEYLVKINEMLKLYNAKILWNQNLLGVEPKEDNKLVNLCENVYKEIYKKNMKRVISQGVVEGGFFLSKKIDCEYVCLGPNIYDVHSPKERVAISSLKMFYKYLLEILKK